VFGSFKTTEYLQNKHGIYQNKSSQFFKQQHEYLCKQQNSLHSSFVNDSASKKPFLFSFSKSACADEMKRTIREAESAIKPYLKIVATLLHCGKHALDKVEQIPWYNNEHWML